MTARPLLTAARHFAAVTGIFLIALTLIAWRHGTLDIISALRSSLLNMETTLRGWYNILRLR